MINDLLNPLLEKADKLINTYRYKLIWGLLISIVIIIYLVITK